MERIPGVIARHFNYSSKKCQILFVNNNEWINNFQFLYQTDEVVAGTQINFSGCKINRKLEHNRNKRSNTLKVHNVYKEVKINMYTCIHTSTKHF